MANSKGPSSMKNMMYNGKNSLLPPKIPFPSISPSYLDYIPSSMLGQKGIPRSREGNPHHQRTSSESCLIEEQPLWLDELLNEPETPVRKGNHRRSSSDSFTYMDSNLDIRSKHTSTTPNWGLQDIDYYKGPYYPQLNSSVKVRNQGWDVNLNSRGVPCPRDRSMVQSAKSLSTGNENLDPIDGGSHEVQGFSERKESSHAKPSGSDSDTKRAKQQFAQRSRVRKLQYISELERNVQALQAEGSDMSAEVEFLSQQSLILSMENKALKQRLENLAQEQLIKYVEHEVLEREVARLRALYQQQQLKKKEQHQQPSSGIRRTNSRDLDQRFASLSLKHKDTNTGRDAVSGQLHI